MAADGSWAPGWTPGGVTFDFGGYVLDRDPGSPASLRAFADGRGGVFMGRPVFHTEGISVIAFERWSGGGATVPGGLTDNQTGLECASRGDGGMYAASFHPSGPTSAWSPNAYVRVAQSDPGPGFVEYHDTPYEQWFGDVGLTTTGDGGAIFVWSQVIVRHGVFAVRVGPEGVVTAVPPSLTPGGSPSLRLRFVPGVGIRVRLNSVPAGLAVMSLFDVNGRLVASTPIQAAPAREEVLSGTEHLPSGMYFAVLEVDGLRLHSRVVVTH